MKRVLGLNYSWNHDSGIAVVDDNFQVLYAASEERYTRFKKEGRFPKNCLARAKKLFPEIDAIAVASTLKPGPVEPDAFWDDDTLRISGPGKASVVGDLKIDLSALNQLWDVEIHYYDHHLCHAEAGFSLSGFEDALIVTCDGGMWGCPWNMAIYQADSENGIKFLHGRSHADFVQVVRLYTDVTAILGFRPNLHEGKITGLSGRGTLNEACEASLLKLESEINEAVVPLYTWCGLDREDVPAILETNPHLARRYRKRLEEFSDADIAHAVQRITEHRVLHIVRKAKAETRAKNLVVAGGIFANVKVNLECMRLGFEKFFVCPPMGDDGICFGAAVRAMADLEKKRPPVRPINDLYWGDGLEAEEVTTLLDELGVVYKRSKSIANDLAELLSQGKTVARVVGRMEFGPRALGHRSVLHQADDPQVNDWLNQKLKRTEFMPFAPAVRKERAAECFLELEGAEHTARFMTLCLPCTDEFKKLCPGVVHVDGTARPQLVDREGAPDFYDILLAYEKLSGLPALINTSFNVHDEPIVCSSSDAVLAFFQSGLDVLAIEDTVVLAEENEQIAAVVALTDSQSAVYERKARREVAEEYGQSVAKANARSQECEEASAYFRDKLKEAAQFAEQLENVKLTWFEPELERLTQYIEQLEKDKSDWYELEIARLRESGEELKDPRDRIKRSLLWRMFSRFTGIEKRPPIHTDDDQAGQRERKPSQ